MKRLVRFSHTLFHVFPEMRRSNLFRTAGCLALMLAQQVANAQVTVFSDDFSTNTSATYTTSGAIGASAWSVSRSGDDWGGRRNTSPAQLELTNDVGATGNVLGWVLASTPSSSFPLPYRTTLSSNPGVVTWTFNMQQIRPDPAGFGSGSYGMAFILAGQAATSATAGNGYAVVLGQSLSVDSVRLVRYTTGLQGTLTNIIKSNTVGLTDFGAEYLSIKVTYTPSTNTWQLFLRNDGASAFADPATGTLTSQGTAVDNTYTGVALALMGAYWQGSTTAVQTAFFDNTTVTVVCPAITFTATPTGACPSGNNGQIAVSGVTGGTAPYMYSSDNGANYQSGATLTGLAANTYQVVVKDANGCTSGATSVMVNSLTPPTCSVSGASAVCSNSAGNVYSAPGGMSAYNWSVSGNGVPIGATTNPSVTVTAGGSGSYTVNVTVTDGNGCNSTCSQPVTINALPVCAIIGPPPSPGPSNDTLCIGHQYEFSTTGGMSAYKWGVTANGTIDGSATGSSVSITVNSGSFLQVRDTVTDANGCMSTCIYNRPVQASPTCTVNGPPTVCGGSTGNVYTITTNGQYYTWSISGNGTIVGSTTGSSVTVTAGVSGTYTITATTYFSFNTCYTTCSETVTINPASAPTITGPTSVCSGGSVMLDAGAGYSLYSWSGGGGSGQTATYNNITSPTTYTVTVTNNGCTGTDSHTVTVNPLPACSVSGADYVCSNSTGNVYSAPGGMSAYSWASSSNGTITSATNGSSVTVTAGNYLNCYTVSVTITDGNGCTSSCSKQSCIFLLTPPANITVNPSPACFGVTLDLSTSMQQASSTISWSGEGIVNPSGSFIPAGFFYNNVTTAIPTTTGPHTYTVTVTTDQGCSNTGTASVTINPLPAVGCPGNSSVCSNVPAYTLTGGSPGGGTYSGPGVSAGMFNPATAGVGTHTIAYTVTDGGTGCTNSCTFTIEVTTCTIDFSGRIKFSNDTQLGVKDARVNLTGSATGVDTSDVNGDFFIATNLPTGSFTLKPTKTINKLNGVSMGDVTAIQQHVANTVPITDMYKLVGADVNKSNSVTTLDASLLNQALLGSQSALAQITSWRFVPTSHTMTNPPWGFPEQRTYTNINSNQTNQDFYGIKLGDVVTTYANPSNFGAGQPFVLRTSDQVLKAGEPLTVDFSADQWDDLAAFQLGLTFDPAQLRFEAVEPLSGLPLTANHFGTYKVASGELRAAWSQPVGMTVAEAAAVFRLRFTALQSGAKLSEVLRSDDAVLPALAYTSKLVESGVELIFDAATGTNAPSAVSALNLQVRPNPFREETTVSFQLPEAGEAQLRVLDVNGRELLRISKAYPAGNNSEALQLELVTASGVLYCELVTPFGVATRKMVVLR